MATSPKKKYIHNPTVVVDGTPVTSYNPVFRNFMITDRTITDSSQFIEEEFDGVTYRQRVHKNINGEIVQVDPVEIYDPATWGSGIPPV